MPNPHIDVYGCMGNYLGTINNLLVERNYVAAIEQCIASAKSLNFGDGVVIGRFAEDIRRTGRSCIELPDGTMKTPKDAVRWLEENSTTEDDNNE